MKKNILSLAFAAVALLMTGTACVKEFDTVLNHNLSTDTDVSDYMPKITYGSVNLGTYNLLISTKGSGSDYEWAKRKTVLAQSIVENDFDIFGFQEADKGIRNELPALVKAAAPAESTRNYEWWFVCRDNQAATTGEALGIAWDTNRFDISDQHYFWLTDKDPDVMNVGWDETSYHRMAACAVFTEKATERKFFLMVTHMPLAAAARQGAATLINEREAMYNPDKLPSFLVGDMNATPDDAASAVFRNAKWNDSFEKVPASARIGQVITFHGQKPIADKVDAQNRIDYIYYKNLSKVLTYKVDYTSYGAVYPSDHCPVSVSFDIPEPPAPAALQGTGTEADPFQIASVEDWNTVAKSVNDGGAYAADAHYILTADLSFSGNFTRIATFGGTLDGANHSMTGITGEAEGENFGGIINVLDATGVIRNLNVEATLSTAFKNMGGVVGIDTAGSLIDGVTFKGDLTGTGETSRIGGIIGTSYSVIVNCGCLGGKIEAGSATKSENLGGIAGRIEQNTAIMANCFSFIEKIVSSQNNFGGVTGGLGTNAYCVNVYSTCTDLSSTLADGSSYGGCIGYSKSGNIRNVYAAAESAWKGSGTQWVANDKEASDWATAGAALTLANMKSGAVTLPSSGAEYASFVDALNAGVADWNAIPSVGALQGKEAPIGIVNKPDVTLRKWVVDAATGYPVLSAAEVGPVDPGQPGPIGDPIVVPIVFKDYAAANGWIVGTEENALTQMYTSVSQNGVTIVAGGDEGAENGVYNSPKYYDWRFYQNRGGQLTISVPDGYRLVSVTFDYNLSGEEAYNKGGVLLTPDGEQCLDETETPVSGQSATFVVGNRGTATNGQARILSITVKYVAWGIVPPDDPGTGDPTLVSVDFDQFGPEKGWENGKNYETVEIGSVTLKASWEGENPNGVYYVGESPTLDDWRFYQARKGGVTISVPSGHTLVKATFTYTNKNGGVLIAPDGEANVASGEAFTLSGQSATFTVGSTTGATNGQARINKIEIEYK